MQAVDKESIFEAIYLGTFAKKSYNDIMNHVPPHSKSYEYSSWNSLYPTQSSLQKKTS